MLCSAYVLCLIKPGQCQISALCSTPLMLQCVLSILEMQTPATLHVISPMDRSLRNHWVASYCSWAFWLNRPRTLVGNSSSCCQRQHMYSTNSRDQQEGHNE